MPFVYTAISIFSIVVLAFIFKKAGFDAWKAIIPFYNLYILYKISGLNGWFFLLEFVPIANIVFNVIICINLADAFKKSTGFAVGLFFIPVVFGAIIAFDQSTYTYSTKVKI